MRLQPRRGPAGTSIVATGPRLRTADKTRPRALKVVSRSVALAGDRAPVLRTLSLALLVALALPAGARAQDSRRLKPGARGPICLSCHTDIQDQMKLPSVHTPVKAGDCSDCHNPHASPHGRLLAADPGAICAECHGDVAPAESRSIHPALAEAGCVACHDPHASTNPKNLLAPHNELCGACHAEIVQNVEEAKFQHAPAADTCLHCHDPHASANSPKLLKAPLGDLCGGCHDSAAASFLQRHEGYPVAGSACTSCHNPHGSERPGILRTSLHEPMGNRLCQQCHSDPGSPEPLALRREGVRLCAGCHNDVVNEALSRKQIHWPVVEGKACLQCHSPHASDQEKLLKGTSETLCGSCHPDVIESQRTSQSSHPPVAAGECTACHAPHAADQPFLSEAPSILELCGTCHDWESHSSHPIGPDVADPRNPNLIVDCSSCHRPHGSPFKGLTHRDPSGDLCVQCHMQVAR